MGGPDLAVTSAELGFDSSSLRDTDNVLTVVMDYAGHDEANVRPAGAQNPRGILGVTLTGSDFTSWRIQGNAGGEAIIDPVRGLMNKGGRALRRASWVASTWLRGADHSWERVSSGRCIWSYRPFLPHDFHAGL